MKRGLTRSLLINGVVIVVLGVLVEFGSWATIKSYQWLRSGTRDAAGVLFQMDNPIVSAADDPLATYSSPGVPADLARNAEMPGSPYRYFSYLVYRNRPFQSQNLNVAPDGMRLNGKAPLSADDATDVWMFGSSPTFGGTNGDSETIPAMLERALVERLAGRKIRVSNFGTVGYTSWQDLLNFAMRLSERPKPKLVVFMNGINDHQLGWFNTTPECEFLFHTAVGSSEALTTAWDVRANRDVILWPVLLARIELLFSNTLDLRKLIIKFLDWKAANRDIETWRAQYRERRDRVNQMAKSCLERAQANYLRNMGMAARLATDNGIKVVFVDEPILFETKKQMVGPELTEAEAANLNNFALTDAELAALRDVPTYRIHQAYVWDRELYIGSYQKQKKELGALAGRLGARFIDLQPAIDKAGPVAIFSTRIHYTFRGARLVGGSIAEGIADLLKE